MYRYVDAYFSVLVKGTLAGFFVNAYFKLSFYVLVNGTSTAFFHSSGCLREGDPLSPYLFVLLMEAKSILHKKARDGSCLTG